MKHLPVVLIALGAALLVFGLLGFDRSMGGDELARGFGIEYSVGTRVIAALGALGLAGGLALRGSARTTRE